jgi:subfamily B ATP-binding cassette protein MsbA
MIVVCLEYGNVTSLIVLLVGLPLLLLPLMLITRSIRKIYRNSFKKIANVTSRMHEVFSGILVVKSYNMEEAEHLKFHGENRKYLRAVIRALRLQLLMEPLTETISIGGGLFFLVYAYSKGVTITQLTALMAPAIVAYQPIKKMTKLVTSLQRSIAGADRYFEIIDTHTELPENESIFDKNTEHIPEVSAASLPEPIPSLIKA